MYGEMEEGFERGSGSKGESLILSSNIKINDLMWVFVLSTNGKLVIQNYTKNKKSPFMFYEKTIKIWAIYALFQI